MKGERMKILALIAGAMVLASPAFAAGIDSRVYSCAALHSLVATRGFVFISQPFGDFVVLNVSYCSGSGSVILQRRSLVTVDQPECLVNYCMDRPIDGRTD
jgi:hypothetical protein